MADPAAMAELKALGSRTLATVVIDGEVFEGFFPNIVRIRAKLGIQQ